LASSSLPASTFDSSRAASIVLPSLPSVPVAQAAVPDSLTEAAEAAVHMGVEADASLAVDAMAAPAAPEAPAADASAAPAEAVQPAVDTAPVQAPVAPPAPIAPVASGWQAPNVARIAFDPEIEQWRPLVREELARASAEGRLRGGANKLDDDVVLALIEQESGGDAQAYSWAGAMGLTQVMPFTYADMIYGDESVTDSLSDDEIMDPRQNVRAGIRYLAMAMQDFGGNLYWSLSSYNAGIGAVEEWRSLGLASVPPIGGYVETAGYAPSILSNLMAHRPGLAVNIPGPMSDDDIAAAIDRLVNAGLW
jgi:soluble lytic murein transglycosylase-like protein